MDFLDPKRKKAHRRRLLIGYVLMAVAVSMGTLILLFSAYGFDIDRKTGDIIQNGTVFLDSQPGGSTVILDGITQGNKTASRLALPGGHQYHIKLESDGDPAWERTFALEGGSIERLVYPLLIPTNLETSDTQLYASSPGISSQSLDRRRLLVQQPGQTYNFDFYDLSNPGNAPASLIVPASILTDPAKPAVVSVVEWAGDNRHVLLDRLYDGKHEFIMFDTETPASSLNINVTLGVTPSVVSLRDRKFEQLYIFDANGGVLRSADTKARNISAPLLSNVIAYKSYGSDLILYATKDGAAEGKTNFRIRENDKATYLLKDVPSAGKYALDIAEFDGTPYFAVGGDTSDAVFVYRNPLSVLKGQVRTPLLVTSVLRLKNPQFVTFSPNGNFVAAQAGKDFQVLDIEGDRQFKVALGHPLVLTDKTEWMDGYRFKFTDGGFSYMIDFDGSNEQKLAVASTAGGPYFAPDSKAVFSLAPSATVQGRFAFTQTSLVKK